MQLFDHFIRYFLIQLIVLTNFLNAIKAVELLYPFLVLVFANGLFDSSKGYSFHEFSTLFKWMLFYHFLWPRFPLWDSGEILSPSGIAIALTKSVSSTTLISIPRAYNFLLAVHCYKMNTNFW